MAFLRLPTKRDGPLTQAPKVVPKVTPRVVANRPVPGPTTVAEGPKRRLLGLGGMRVGQQYTILGAIFAVLFVVAAFYVFKDNREATYGTTYVSTSAQMRMLSQRIAKAAQTGLIGSPEAFKQLQQSREEFITALKLLREGGQSGDTSLPPTSDMVIPQLDALTREWDKTDRSVQLVIKQAKNLIGLASAVRLINANNPVLLDLAEQIQALKLQSQAPAREISLSGQLVMLTQRLARNANAMLGADVIDPEVAFLMGKDTTSFREVLQGLSKGSDVLRVAAAKDSEQQAKLAELAKAYQEFQTAVASILGNLQALVNAKEAGRRVVDDSEALLAASQKLTDGYEMELGGRAQNFIVLGFLVLAGIGVIALLVTVYLGDTRRRLASACPRRLSASDQQPRLVRADLGCARRHGSRSWSVRIHDRRGTGRSRRPGTSGPRHRSWRRPDRRCRVVARARADDRRRLARDCAATDAHPDKGDRSEQWGRGGVG